MSFKMLNKFIVLKEYISKNDYKEINTLKDICTSTNNINLKLELDYRLAIFKDYNMESRNINEFFYYIDNILVSYLSISSFGRNIGELTGMTHPNWRRKGLFKKLFYLTMNECKERKFDKILLLSDGNSTSGIQFINNVGAEYTFSEYRMNCYKKAFLESSTSITLRKATENHKKEINRQNSIFFNCTEEDEEPIEIPTAPNEITYMIELNKNVIGKIRVDYNDNSAFICGFGILPEFRGNGYGKSALKETLTLINRQNIYDIELDVECKNNTALNLYKSCGFEEKSVMNYYEI